MSCDIKNETCGFQCTGSDESHVWSHLHNKVPKMFNCGTCSSHYETIMYGLHDFVNIGLGKEPKKVKEFEKLHDEIQCAYNSCKEKGFCK